jgi:hypothetical protein
MSDTAEEPSQIDAGTARVMLEEARDEGLGTAAERMREQRDELTGLLAKSDEEHSHIKKRLTAISSETHSLQHRLLTMAKQKADRELEVLAARGNSVLLPDGRILDLGLENSMEDNEVLVQCMSFTQAQGGTTRALFFVVQFYHFLPVRTESAWLGQAAGSAQILCRDGATPADANSSIAVKYVVHNNTPSPPRAFASYLATGVIHLEVWDAESLIQLGTVRLSLDSLLRQGRGQVEQIVNAPVRLSTTIGGTDSYGAMQGQVQLRMVCTARSRGNTDAAGPTMKRNWTATRCPVVTIVPQDASSRPAETVKLSKRALESERTRQAVEATECIQADTIQMWRLRATEATAELAPTAPGVVKEEREALLARLFAVRHYARESQIVASLQRLVTRHIRLCPTVGSTEHFELVYESSFAETEVRSDAPHILPACTS